MISYKKITHVIFDMDGLLLDTEPFYTEATQQIVSRYGKTYDWTLKSKMIGRGAADSARILVEALELPIRPEDYLEERTKITNKLFPTAKPLPGAEKLTRHLHHNHIPQAVATSSSQDNFDLKTIQHHQWFSIFSTIVTANHPAVHKPKPSPDIFLAAAQELRVDPDKCLVFEDAPTGMNAALAAGMSIIAVPDPNMDKSIYDNAHQILSSLEEFQPQLWDLPPY